VAVPHTKTGVATTPMMFYRMPVTPENDAMLVMPVVFGKAVGFVMAM